MRGEQAPQGSLTRGGFDPLAINRAVAWTGFFLGAATGMVMGLWSFDGPVRPPDDLASYGDTARRLLRLGHIACFGIGYLNLMLANQLRSLPIDGRRLRTTARLMNFGNVFLPLTLMTAAAVPAVKFLLPVPALAITLALAITAWHATQLVCWQRSRRAGARPAPRHHRPRSPQFMREELER